MNDYILFLNVFPVLMLPVLQKKKHKKSLIYFITCKYILEKKIDVITRLHIDTSKQCTGRYNNMFNTYVDKLVYRQLIVEMIFHQ